MKKLFFIGALALISLAACQNETSNPDELQALKIEQAGKNAVNFIKRQSASQKSDVSTDPIGPNDAVIDCHQAYALPSGHACVWSNGFLFKVSWTTMIIHSTPDYINTEKVYYSERVSFCNCN